MDEASAVGFGHQLPRQIDALKAELASPILFRFRPAAPSGASSIPACSCWFEQFDDRTYRRETSFFGNGCVAHVSMALPVAPRLQRRIAEAAGAENNRLPFRRNLCLHRRAAILFARRVAVFSGAGADVIGMTGATEAKLAPRGRDFLRDHRE